MLPKKDDFQGYEVNPAELAIVFIVVCIFVSLFIWIAFIIGGKTAEVKDDNLVGFCPDINYGPKKQISEPVLLPAKKQNNMPILKIRDPFIPVGIIKDETKTETPAPTPQTPSPEVKDDKDSSNRNAKIADIKAEKSKEIKKDFSSKACTGKKHKADIIYYKDYGTYSVSTNTAGQYQIIPPPLGAVKIDTSANSNPDCKVKIRVIKSSEFKDSGGYAYTNVPQPFFNTNYSTNIIASNISPTPVNI